MSLWNEKMMGHQAASGQVLVNSAFTLSSLLSNVYQFCASNMWVLQHHSVYALHMSTIVFFVYLGLQYRWNQLSPNNSRHISCIHEGLHAGKWPDLMTSKPDAQYTVIPVDRRHRNHTGLCYRQVVFQWKSCVNVHNRNTGSHWSHKFTGMPLESHWLMLTPSGIPVAIQC